MRQRPHVLNEILLRADDRPDAAARVVVAVVHGHGVFHDRADALADPAAPSPAARARTFRSVSTTSALVSSDTASLPSRGKANRAMLDNQSLPCFGFRQPGRIYARTASAAAAKVGMLWRRPFSACGSPPARASLRLARARARASLSGTSGKPPSPSSRRRPRMSVYGGRASDDRARKLLSIRDLCRYGGLVPLVASLVRIRLELRLENGDTAELDLLTP